MFALNKPFIMLALCVYIPICIYIYIYREREREKYIICAYIYIYIYVVCIPIAYLRSLCPHILHLCRSYPCLCFISGPYNSYIYIYI